MDSIENFTLCNTLTRSFKSFPLAWYSLQIHSYVLTYIDQLFLMIIHIILLLLTVSFSTDGLGTVNAYQNISEEIYKMFGNLTPDYLGFNNFSYERPGGFSISSMPSINTSSNSIAGTQWYWSRLDGQGYFLSNLTFVKKL